MASEADESSASFIETLINSRNRDISLFLPFILGLNAANRNQGPENRGAPDRIILINPYTQGMVIIERSSSSSSDRSSSFDSLINELFSNKGGQPPASKASIDAMESVEIVGGEKDDDHCVVCLEEWEIGEKVKEMPCKHRFHGECIEKWLKIHGSCPVCRYQMPVDEADDEVKRSDGERRRGVWVSLMFSERSRNGENDQSVDSESSDSLTSHQENSL